MTNYSDPPNCQERIEQLTSIFTNPDLDISQKHEEIRLLIDTVFPGWFISTINEYSEDYPHFQNNWKLICASNKTEPKFIILVDEIHFTQRHVLLHTFFELMTRFGYVVRRKEEFGTCICGKAIPSKQIYDLLKGKDIKVPEEWSERCSKCK